MPYSAFLLHHPFKSSHFTFGKRGGGGGDDEKENEMIKRHKPGHKPSYDVHSIYK